jgi:tRNA A37 methylthiotransferase MiaB
LRALKDKFPTLKITTHMMVGFPGESENDFQKSLAFIREFEFPYVDIYGYENRPRTEASQLDGKIPQPVINQRVKQLRQAQEEVLAKAASAN